MVNVTKLVRTIQSELPFLRQPKQVFQDYRRRLTRTPHEHDFHALRLIPESPDELFLDIGANHGQSIGSIRLFRPGARLIAFEPNPALTAKLQGFARRDLNLEFRPYGLGAASGSFDLHVPSYNGWIYDGLASISRAEAEGWISPETVYLYRPSRLKVQSSVCEIQTLDAQGLSPSFMKIDVQGLEYEVLLGGLETLKRCSPILMVEAFGPGPMSDLLVELGYRPFSFDGSGFSTNASTSPNTFLIPPTHSVSGIS